MLEVTVVGNVEALIKYGDPFYHDLITQYFCNKKGYLKGKKPSSTEIRSPSHHPDPDSDIDDDVMQVDIHMCQEDATEDEFVEIHAAQGQVTSRPSSDQLRSPTTICPIAHLIKWESTEGISPSYKANQSSRTG